MHRGHIVAGTVLVCLCWEQAAALETTLQLDSVAISVYAPDWTWQKRDINVLVVLANHGDDDAVVTLDLRAPADRQDHFTFAQDASPAPDVPINVTVTARATVRQAYTGITARDDVPRQEYVFTLVVRSAGQEVSIPYPVRTIRGAAVSPGKWALYLPAGVALVWSIVFAWVLSGMGRPGAWKIAPKPIDMADGAAP